MPQRLGVAMAGVAAVEEERVEVVGAVEVAEEEAKAEMDIHRSYVRTKRLTLIVISF